MATKVMNLIIVANMVFFATMWSPSFCMCPPSESVKDEAASCCGHNKGDTKPVFPFAQDSNDLGEDCSGKCLRKANKGIAVKDMNGSELRLLNSLDCIHKPSFMAHIFGRKQFRAKVEAFYSGQRSSPLLI